MVITSKDFIDTMSRNQLFDKMDREHLRLLSLEWSWRTTEETKPIIENLITSKYRDKLTQQFEIAQKVLKISYQEDRLKSAKLRTKLFDAILQRYPYPDTEVIPMFDWDKIMSCFHACVSACHNPSNSVLNVNAALSSWNFPYKTYLHSTNPKGFEFDRDWLTNDCIALAKGIAAERAFDRMPILADALQDAGCNNEEILSHLRNDVNEFTRADWILLKLCGINFLTYGIYHL